MRHHLTRYLLLHGRVGILHVGNLRLVQRSPVLNVADRTLEPPSYTVEIQPDETLSDHQLKFLRNATGKEGEEIETALHRFGSEMQKAMALDGYEWEGLGKISNETKALPLNVAALQSLAAEKVTRPEAVHNVLVGDRELTAAQAMEGARQLSPTKGRAVSIVIGWVLLVLAVLSIAVLLYLGKFSVGSAGSQLSPTGWW